MIFSSIVAICHSIVSRISSIFMYLDIEIRFNFLLLKINSEIDFIIIFIDTVDLLCYL